MAILSFPFGAINTALSLLLMHGISVTMFRSFLNQTLPSMEASSSGNRYQITLNKPAAKISNFIPEEIKFIQQQLNSRNNRNTMMMDVKNASIGNLNNLEISNTQQLNRPSLQQSPLQSLNLQPLNIQSSNLLSSNLQQSPSILKTLNPIGSSSNIIQHISQIRQQPFTGTISLHNQGQSILSDINSQLNKNLLNAQIQPNLKNDNQLNLINSSPLSQHISSMNLPFTTAGLNPIQKPKIVHVHHDIHSLDSGLSSSLSNYQNINSFESNIPSGSTVLFEPILSKRNGLGSTNKPEPLIKEIPLNKIIKFLEKKKRKELKKEKVNPIRIVCSFIFDEFAKEPLDPKLIDEDASFCTHLNIHNLIINSNYEVSFKNLYQDTMRLSELMKIKNKNKNLKFILSIGNESNIQTYDAICSNLQLMNRFIDSVLDIIKIYELDGINFNFKFDLSVSESNLSFLFKQNLIQMLRQFREELNRIGKHKFIVSALLPNSPIIIKTYFDLEELNGLLDYVNVIGYEFYEYRKENPAIKYHSPLYASKDDNLAWLIKNWLNTELDKNKLNIGLSTFGRSYNLALNNVKSIDGPLVGLGINNETETISYSNVCKFLSKNDTTYIYNEKHQVPLAYNGYDLISFENEKSLSVKARYLSKLKIGGVMLFALNYDDTNGNCNLDYDDEFNRFPLHKVVFKTMEIASLVTRNL